MSGRRSVSVAFDMTFADRNRGGSWVYAHSLLDALRARGDVDVSLVSAPAGAGTAATLRWLARDAARELSSYDVDLLHCPAFVCPWRLRVPQVITIPDTLARRFPGDHPLEWRVYERWLLPPLARGAAFVLTGTEFSRRQLVDEYGLDADRVVVTPLGIDGRFFEHPWRARAEASDPPRLLFPGAPLGRKNLTAVLHCMAGAASRSALARAVLEVSGATARDFPDHARDVEELGLHDRVRWLGHVDRAQMPAVVSRADLLVYPSLYEGFGLPPLEAMAVGTPVVAANRSCLPEVYGDAAVLVDPLDLRKLSEALDAVLSRPQLRLQLREAGRRQCALYTWERTADETRHVYADVQSAGRHLRRYA